METKVLQELFQNSRAEKGEVIVECVFAALKAHTPDAARFHKIRRKMRVQTRRVFLRQTEIGRDKHGRCWGLRRRIVVTFTAPPAFASKTDCVDSSNLGTKATTWGISSSRTRTSATEMNSGFSSTSEWDPKHLKTFFFFCVGVVYSGEYDVCDVTLEYISTPGELENYARPRWPGRRFVGSIPTVTGHSFQARPVWIYTQE